MFLPTLHRSTVITIAVLLSTAAWAQDQGREFHWRGKLATDQLLTIKNINGDIDANASDAGEVQVTAVKSGPNADQIRIEVVPGSEGVTICAVYPGDSDNCGSDNHHYGTSSHGNNGKVHFTVQMPKNLRLEADNVNGNVNADGMGREVRANSVNGNVDLSTTSWAEAKTVNGRIKAAMGDAGWNGTLQVESVNGSIELDMPGDFNADVNFSSVNGHIDSDFPLTVNNSWPVGHSAKGTVGKGGRELAIK
ncbi:MAG TPA: DUF4097 family beta strand repeat-containing protein, partial [Terriglobales bacterium]|nr:DUF4097 family beta strand repeat-containing protein [Terriglobales bacterium]